MWPDAASNRKTSTQSTKTTTNTCFFLDTRLYALLQLWSTIPFPLLAQDGAVQPAPKWKHCTMVQILFRDFDRHRDTDSHNTINLQRCSAMAPTTVGKT
mmetsp:Transcript_25030/g.36660  ORF Transcript_25030/g.36660 Transcript_25030/m.36660 type:complete len:99 (+) Transcript_25030:735-1031(+)